MDVHHLVTMANDIGRFFDSEVGPESAPGNIASHIARFWEPRMRRAIIVHARAGGEGLGASSLAAVLSLPLPEPRR